MLVVENSFLCECVRYIDTGCVFEFRLGVGEPSSIEFCFDSEDVFSDVFEEVVW